MGLFRIMMNRFGLWDESEEVDEVELSTLVLENGRLECANRIANQVIEEYRAVNRELIGRVQQLQKKIAGTETDCRMAINAMNHIFEGTEANSCQASYEVSEMEDQETQCVEMRPCLSTNQTQLT